MLKYYQFCDINNLKEGGVSVKKLCLILSCCIILSISAVTTSCSFPKMTSEKVRLEYKLNEDKTSYRVTGSNIAYKTLEDNWEMVDVVIPSEYKGLPVTEISVLAFRSSDILRSVTIPESIERIVAGAFFDCNKLESVNIPKSVNYIAGAPFESCNSLREIIVDPQNEYYCSIDGNLFSKDKSELVCYTPGKAQTEFIIPEGVSVVHKSAFSHCEFLKSIVLSATVTEFPHDAIMFCNSLQGISIDENNPTYRAIDGNLYSKDGKTFLKFCVSDEKIDLVIPDGVTSISAFAAYYCDDLTSVVIPETVNFIGESAFSQCTSLSEAVFENASGWRVIPQGGKFQSTKNLDKTELCVPTIAAEYLSQAYYSWEWHCEN